MENWRPLLITYAYNITGSLEEAEDIVQDAFLEFLKTNPEKINLEKAYLTRMVINMSINRKRRMYKNKGDYPGEWLPEPVSTETADLMIQRQEVLSYSLMILLEQLDAQKRAVFILREAFHYDHSEIAEMLDISIENSRKLLSRAKKLLKKQDFSPSSTTNVPNAYLEAIQVGDIQMLEKILKKDISMISDGGGKVPAGRKTIMGSPSVMAMLLGLYKKFYTQATIQETQINHQPALLYFSPQGQLINCQVFDLSEGVVQKIYFIRNPEKLKAIKKIG